LEFHTFAVWGKEIKAVQNRTCEKRVFVTERIKHIQPRPESDRSPQPYRHGPITAVAGTVASAAQPGQTENQALAGIELGSARPKLNKKQLALTARPLSQ
jgi:hypothetical protein